jgi:hypothetical protein
MSICFNRNSVESTSSRIWVTDRRIVFRLPEGAGNVSVSQIQAGFGSHLGPWHGSKNDGGLQLITHLYLVLELRLCGVIPPYSNKSLMLVKGKLISELHNNEGGKGYAKGCACFPKV